MEVWEIRHLLEVVEPLPFPHTLRMSIFFHGRRSTPADEFVVRAAANGKYDYITVKVNTGEADDDVPVPASDDATILHNENTQTVITVVAEDPDDSGAITYSLASEFLIMIYSQSIPLRGTNFISSPISKPNGCNSIMRIS